MGAIFEALGGGLRGLQEGLLMRQDLKQQQFQNEGETLERQMQQREFTLRMKQLGLQLEEAEYNAALRKAQGLPEEVIKRELEREQAKAQQDFEKFQLQQQKVQSEISENEAQADYYRQGGARSRAGAAEKKDTTYTDAIKIIDGQVKQLESVLDDATTTGDEERANAIRQQITELLNQREVMVNFEFAQMDLPMDQFGMGGNAAAQEQTEQPESNNVVGLLDRTLRPPEPTAPEKPRLAGELRLPDWMRGTSINPIKGYGGLFSALAGIAAETPSPLAPTMKIPGTGQQVVMNRATPEMIERMKLLGLIQSNRQ